MRRVVALGKEIVAVARAEELTFLAAAIAYYALVSIFPLLLLVLSAASVFGGEALAAEIVETAGTALSPVETDLIRNTLVGASGRGGATVFGLLVLLWSGLKVFRGLDVAFGHLYQTDESKPFLSTVRDALVVLVGVAVAVGTTVAVSTLVALSALVGETAGVVGNAGLVVVLGAMFLPLYYFLPDHQVGVGEAVPGTLFAAVSWALLAAGFGFYADSAGSFQLYGVVGGVLLLVTWLYLGAIVLLFGATLNVVLAEHRDRHLQHPPSRQ
ncbi:YihY/virulence factor BrkB family protein [Haloarculaceae archaeon H-GB2-1]|nr:YihY/virulence factor BrkB family protein [Haloarculaceae archaeon H-GB11]MEA5407136.1 YihY/virulence factor BrkB family protein [Haloarculaceae archaeon H-GB2-1]